MALAGLLLGALGMPAAPAAAAEGSVTYYVSPSGDDAGGQGTEASPWRTIGYAVSRAAAGDTVKLMDDDNEATDDYVEEVTVDKTLTITRYNGSGANPQVRGLGNYAPVFRISGDNITLRGLDIYAGSVQEVKTEATRNNGIALESCRGCSVADNRVGWDSNHSAGGWFAVEVTGGEGNSFRNNSIRYFGMAGIFLNASDGNTIRGNTLCDSLWSQGSAIFVQDGESNTITRNTVMHNMCTGMISGGRDNHIYLNCLYDNLGLTSGQPNACGGGSENLWHSPQELTYIYNSVEYTGFLGNYYGDYAGRDDGSGGRTAGDGVGDTGPYSFMDGSDPYPLTDISVDAYRLPGDQPPPPPAVSAPVAGFSASAAWGVAPFTVVFSDESDGERIESWLWDFGDGVTSSCQNPSHMYQTMGAYSVSLTVANSGGSHSAVREDCILVIDDLAWHAALGDLPLPTGTEEAKIVAPAEGELEDTGIMVQRTSSSTPACYGYVMLGSANTLYRFSGTFFRVEGAENMAGGAAICVEYSEADLAAAGGDPDRLTLSRYDEPSGRWLIAQTTVDSTAGRLTTISSHSGRWAVMAAADPAADPSGFPRWGWMLAGLAAIATAGAIMVMLRRRPYGRHGLSLFVLLALVLSICAIGRPGPAVAATASRTYYVGPWGDDSAGQGTEASPWRSVGYAVSRAAAGDTIKLMDDDNEATDDYVEDIAVDRGLSIRRYNNSGPNPQVRGLGGRSPVFHVAADGATIAGLDVYAVPVDGDGFPVSIELAYCRGCRIENNRLGWDLNHLAGGAAAIRIMGGGNHQIRGNTSKYYGMYGAYVCGSDSNIINNNAFSNSRFVWGAGIWLHGSPSNTVIGNSLSQNLSPGLVVYLDSPGNLIYLNRIFGNAEESGYKGSASESIWHSPEPLTYIYKGATHTGYLGNYYGCWYADDGRSGGIAGDGVGDADQPCPDNDGPWCYPLIDGSPDAYRILGEDTPTSAPVAVFSASATWGVAPFTAVFHNESDGGELTSWQWDFGDNCTSSFENPSHTYVAMGVYTVTLTVANGAGGDEVTREQYILVLDNATWQRVTGR